MSEHYYTARPASEHREETHNAEILDTAFTFVTDNGVFSKGGLDDGTALLIKSSASCEGRIADLGCGWGPVGIALLKAGRASSVVFTDVNERACELCRRNIALNHVQNAFVTCGDGLERAEGLFDHILLNPPIHAGKQVMYRLFEEASQKLVPGGTLRIVIMTRQGAGSAEKKLEELFGNCRIVERGSGYKVLMAVKEEK